MPNSAVGTGAGDADLAALKMDGVGAALSDLTSGGLLGAPNSGDAAGLALLGAPNNEPGVAVGVAPNFGVSAGVVAGSEAAGFDADAPKEIEAFVASKVKLPPVGFAGVSDLLPPATFSLSSGPGVNRTGCPSEPILTRPKRPPFASTPFGVLVPKMLGVLEVVLGAKRELLACVGGVFVPALAATLAS